jgi:5-methylcytosine-specific restriction protein A
MTSQAQRAWVFALSNDEDSHWRSVDDFFANIEESEAGASGPITLRSTVWGKTLRKDMRLQPGDGIAIYHTKRAQFRKPDPYGRRPRISLIGEITRVKQQGQHVSYLEMRFRREDVERSMRSRPLIRDARTEPLFLSSGMGKGAVATFYEIPSLTWGKMVELSKAQPAGEDLVDVRGQSSHPQLAERLQAEMLATYRRAGEEAGYWGYYFLRSVRRNGALATARRMLKPTRRAQVTKGLQALIDARRSDLSLEAVVLRPTFAPLFTSQELREAQRRLSSLPHTAFPTRIPPASNFPETIIEPGTYREGAVRRVEVSAYERDQRAREACIAVRGCRCSVCEMDFETRYGERGKGFIHVHHLKPLAARKRAYTLRPQKDLMPVCPNCHAMLHTQDPPLSVAELRAELTQRDKS